MKKKRNKGFTLIELIVVIAILAILAMIAIPRFAGFTDRAKIAADEQLAAIAKNSALTLIASGDIKVTAPATDVTVVYTQASAEQYTITNATYERGMISTSTAAEKATAFNNAMIDLVGAEKLQKYAKFTITYDGNGEYKSTKLE